MYKIGIDLGGTFQKSILFSQDQILNTAIKKSSKKSNLIEKSSFEKMFKTPINKNTPIFITGGLSQKIDPSKRFKIIPEIDSIAYGASYFYPQLDSFVVMSIGTGTCIVSYQNGITRHIGGSGLGGGTLKGLADYFYPDQENSIQFFFEKARVGSPLSTDITVNEIVGSGIGIVPGEASASHLGKLNSKLNKEDIAAGFINMVATELANLAVFSLRELSLNQLVILGYPIENNQIASIFKKRVKMLNPKVQVNIPEKSVFGSALGAINYAMRSN